MAIPRLDAMLQLGWPWLLMAWPLPLVLAWVLPAERDLMSDALRAPGWTAHLARPQGARAPLRLARTGVVLAAWTFLVVAAARPQWVGEPIALETSGRDMWLAVDISGSMRKSDMRVAGSSSTRLAAVKHVARRFIAGRRGDRLGLVLFGSRAYLQTPLTLDHGMVATLLDEAVVGLAGEATSIGDAVGLALRRAGKREDGARRAVVLLTDGRQTSGELHPLEAAELAAEHDVRIYAIGAHPGQARGDEEGPDVRVLRAMAELTGGRAFEAHDTEGLRAAYDDIDRLEPVLDEDQHLRPIVEYFHVPLTAAMLLSLLLLLSRFVGGGAAGPVAPGTRGEPGTADA